MDEITLQDWQAMPLADYVVALANTNGGRLVLPDADVCVLERVLLPVLQAIRPSLPDITISSAANAAHIEMSRGTTVHALPDGRVMGLSNDGPIRLDGGQIRQLIAARTHDGFENTVVPQYGATVMDVLCCADNPQQWLPHAVIHMNAYEGQYRYRQDIITGTLIEQYHRGGALLAEMLASRGGQHQFPVAVLRELYLNALVHRDYRQKTPIVVQVYPQHITLEIPGGLPGFATLATLQHQHYHRNPKLVHYLIDGGYMEGRGRGLQAITTQLIQSGYTHPQISMPSPYQMNVHIERIASPVQSELNWRQDRALSHIRRHGSLTLRTMRVLCSDETPQALQQDLADLVATGQLQAIGNGENAVYIQRV